MHEQTTNQEKIQKTAMLQLRRQEKTKPDFCYIHFSDPSKADESTGLANNCVHKQASVMTENAKWRADNPFHQQRYRQHKNDAWYGDRTWSWWIGQQRPYDLEEYITKAHNCKIPTNRIRGAARRKEISGYQPARVPLERNGDGQQSMFAQTFDGAQRTVCGKANNDRLTSNKGNSMLATRMTKGLR